MYLFFSKLSTDVLTSTRVSIPTLCSDRHVLTSENVSTNESPSSPKHGIAASQHEHTENRVSIMLFENSKITKWKKCH